MAQDATEVVVGASGDIYTAPVGTTAPTDPTSAYAAGWSASLGYLTEDGVSWAPSVENNLIGAWQSFYPIRALIASRNITVGFSLMQWNTETLRLAFGGGEVTEPSNNVFKYTPPDASEQDERALGIDWADGDEHYRLIIPKGIVSDIGETNLVRTDAAVLPITFSIQAPPAGEDPWFLLTDSAAFVLGS